MTQELKIFPIKCKCNRHPDSCFTVTIRNEIPYCPICGGICMPVFSDNKDGLKAPAGRHVCMHDWIWSNNDGKNTCTKCLHWSYLGKEVSGRIPPKRDEVSVENIAETIFKTQFGHDIKELRERNTGRPLMTTNKREELIKTLKDKSDVTSYFAMSFEKAADFIIQDRKNICEPLVKIRNGFNMPLRSIEDWDKFLKTQLPAIDEILKNAGIETDK